MDLATENRRPRAPSTDCCLGILEALSQHSEGLTLSDLHRLLDVSKNMAFRILNDMTDRGFVVRDSRKVYFLSDKLLQLAIPRSVGRNLVDEATGIACALRNDCRESVGLLVPSGDQAVLVYFLPSLHPIRLIFDLGLRLPCYCNAPGKVFLAFGEEADRAERWKKQSFEARTAHTITDGVQLQRSLVQARRDGYTVDRAEDIEGAHCVAAPVFDHTDQLVAAMVIAAPSQRMPVATFPEFGQKVTASAAALSDRMRR
jgi:DNA-binding IclR family transcriptional regulator